MKASAKVHIQDSVLRGLIYSPNGENPDVTPTDEDSLWEEVDDDVPGDTPDLNVKDVPGGTVTFAFERLTANL